MITPDHFVLVTHPTAKLSRQHRSLVRKHIRQTQRAKYLQVGQPGLSRVLPWRQQQPQIHELPEGQTSALPPRSQDETLSKQNAVEKSRQTIMQAPPDAGGVITGNAHDPYDALPIRKSVDSDPMQALSNLFHGWAPLIEYDSVVHPGNARHPLLEKLLPLAVQDLGLLGAICLDSQFWCGFVNPLVPAFQNRSVLYYQGQAIAGIRKQLSNAENHRVPVEDATIIAVTFLMGIDSYQNDVESEAAHSDAIRRIVSSRGGLDALDSFTRSMLLTFNFWLCRERSEPPLFLRETYAYPIQQSRLLLQPTAQQMEHARTQLPPVFVDLVGQLQLSAQLLDALMRAQAWTLVLQRLYTRRASEADFDAHAHTPALLVVEDLVAVLRKLKDGIRPPEYSDSTGVQYEELICSALILYMLNTIHRGMAQDWNLYQRALTQSAYSLSALFGTSYYSDSPEFEQKKLITWCFMVVMDALNPLGGWPFQNDSMPESLSVWMMETYPSWPGLKIVLENAFCYGGMLKRWKKLWLCLVQEKTSGSHLRLTLRDD